MKSTLLYPTPCFQPSFSKLLQDKAMLMMTLKAGWLARLEDSQTGGGEGLPASFLSSYFTTASFLN